jgi:hypothetical protein
MGTGVAQEFAYESILKVIEETDFAEIVKLPRELEDRLLRKINMILGADRNADSGPTGSYVNTDSLITYRVHLVAERGRAEIAGVPLRYQWRFGTDGSAIVKRIVAFSTEWPPNSRLANIEANDPPSQYDFVALYQAAGVMRQIALSNPDNFRSFVARACPN